MQPGDVAATYADISAISADLGFPSGDNDRGRHSAIRPMVYGSSRFGLSAAGHGESTLRKLLKSE
jgi:hypothetical protein